MDAHAGQLQHATTLARIGLANLRDTHDESLIAPLQSLFDAVSQLRTLVYDCDMDVLTEFASWEAMPLQAQVRVQRGAGVVVVVAVVVVVCS